MMVVVVVVGVVAAPEVEVVSCSRSRSRRHVFSWMIGNTPVGMSIRTARISSTRVMILHPTSDGSWKLELIEWEQQQQKGAAAL